VVNTIFLKKLNLNFGMWACIIAKVSLKCININSGRKNFFLLVFFIIINMIIVDIYNKKNKKKYTKKNKKANE
tara:strand:+ start:985 stop:1203 length:219 start_codon:yes stop_codon:yes gene_type:complete